MDLFVKRWCDFFDIPRPRPSVHGHFDFSPLAAFFFDVFV
jgi:hypothetical protein